MLVLLVVVLADQNLVSRKDYCNNTATFLKSFKTSLRSPCGFFNFHSGTSWEFTGCYAVSTA